jgi:hypothetical protein
MCPEVSREEGAIDQRIPDDDVPQFVFGNHAGSLGNDHGSKILPGFMR